MKYEGVFVDDYAFKAEKSFRWRSRKHRILPSQFLQITQIIPSCFHGFHAHCILGCARLMQLGTHRTSFSCRFALHPLWSRDGTLSAKNSTTSFSGWYNVRLVCLHLVFAPQQSPHMVCCKSESFHFAIGRIFGCRTAVYGPLVDGGVDGWWSTPYNTVIYLLLALWSADFQMVCCAARFDAFSMHEFMP